MKFFTPKPKKPDKSKELLDMTIAKLQDSGITDSDKRLRCSRELLKSTANHTKNIQRAARGKADITEVCLNWTNDLKAILTNFGVTEQETQEEFILIFVDRLADIIEA